MIQLRILGPLELAGPNGIEVRSVLAQPKRLALLAYLALNAGDGFVRRDELLALFWPDRDEDGARAALNRALHFLRRALGSHVLPSRGIQEVGISFQHLCCDAVALERAVHEDRLMDATGCYRGDLLGSFHLDGVPEFDQWLDVERQRLRMLVYRAAIRLCDEPDLDGREAVHRARWVLDRFPYDEAALRRLLHVMAALGERAAAIHEYDAFVRRLAVSLEIEPSPETVAVRARLLRSTRVDGAGEREIAPVVPSAPSVVHDDPDETTGVLAANETGPIRSEAGARPAKRHHRRLGIALPLLVAVAGALVAVIRLPATDPRRIAVLAFDPHDGNEPARQLAQRFTERILVSLRDEIGRLTPAEAGETRIIELAAGSGDIATRARRAGAGILVTGDLFLDRDSIRVHARLLDGVRGDRFWTLQPVAVAVAHPESAVEELSRRILGGVIALRTPSAASLLPLVTPPPYAEAVGEFVTAGAAEDAADRAVHLQRAADIDSTFLWAAMLAAFNLRPWDAVHSDSVLRAFATRRERLSMVANRWLDFALAFAVADRVAIHRALRALGGLSPEFACDAARSAAAIHRPRESLAFIDRERLRGRAPEPGRCWRLRLANLHELSEHPRELAGALRARDDGSGPLEAMWFQTRALAAMGKVRRVNALFDSALVAPEQRSYNPGNIMLTAADEYLAHGYAEASIDAARRAAEWFAAQPAQDSFRHVYDRAQALYRIGEYAQAERLFRVVMTERPRFSAEMLGYLGAMAVRRHDPAAVDGFLDELARVSVPLQGDAYEVAWARARIEATRGDAGSALRLLREAIGAQGIDMHTEFDFQPLRNDPAFRAFTRPKG